MTVRFQKTANGEVAILPRAEYEQLAARAAEVDEDVGTAKIVARAKREVAAGAALIPKQFADRIASGENPLAVIREWRDVPQLRLMFLTDLSQGYISDLENGRRKGTTAALRRIAKALDVPLESLLSPD
jgi:hypothetical protein